MCSICTNWLNTRTFWPSATSGSSNSNSVSVLPEAESLPTSAGWQQIWRNRVSAASTCILLLFRPCSWHGLHDLVAAAAQFGEIKFPLLVAQRTIAALLDAIRQILGDVLFQAAQQQRAQLGRKPAARNTLGRLGLLATRFRRGNGLFAARAGFVRLDKLLLVAEVTGLDEIHDAPQIEQPVFERRAGKREAMFGFELLDRLRDLRARVLDELRLVQNHRAEREFLQLLQIAAEQGVVGHDQIMLRDLFAQIVPRRAAFEHEHFQVAA